MYKHKYDCVIWHSVLQHLIYMAHTQNGRSSAIVKHRGEAITYNKYDILIWHEWNKLSTIQVQFAHTVVKNNELQRELSGSHFFKLVVSENTHVH